MLKLGTQKSTLCYDLNQYRTNKYVSKEKQKGTNKKHINNHKYKLLDYNRKDTKKFTENLIMFCTYVEINTSLRMYLVFIICLKSI